MAIDTPINVLFIEDNPTDIRLVQEILRGSPSDQFNIVSASTLAQSLERLSSDHVDVILIDLGLPDSQGFETFQKIEEHASDLPIIVLTVSATEELGIKAIRAGAQRFFSKDVLTPDGAYAEMFPQVIRYAIEHKRTKAELQKAQKEVEALNKQLHIANEELEQRIDQRTTELQITSKRLSAANEALKESEARYRQLIERSFDAVFIHSEGVVQFANEVAARVLKAASPDDLVGMNVLDLPAPRYREFINGRITSVYETGKSTEPVEIQLSARDGTLVDVEIFSTLTAYEGKPALYVVFRDISERKRMEAQLKQYADHLEDLVEERTAQLAQSEEYFRTIFEESSIGQVRYDADGSPIDINSAALALFGVSSLADVRHVSIHASKRIPEEVKAQLFAGQRVRYEDTYDFAAIRERGYIPTSRSDVRYVDVYMFPLFNRATGAVDGYLAQVVDITERKEAEASLAISEEQYRTLVETANSIIIAMKADRTITFVNDYGARFFGYSPEELIGKDVMILVPEVESTGRPLEQHVRDILARPDEYATNLNENVTRDGQRVWVQWVNRGLVDHDGRHVGHLAVGIDVTALKHAEAALKEAERLAAIGQTATMIGHDLRNPLQAMQLLVDLAQKFYSDLSPEQKVGFDAAAADRIFSSVEKQIQYMDKIVSDLQDYSRPLTLEPEEVHLAAFVSDTLALLTIPESVSVSVSATDSITATIDPHLMQRALSNLIMNAVQAMPEGGTLTIGAAAEDHAVVLRIHDTGGGVPEDMRETLFSPLTTGKAKGTGLGLAVVKRIIEAHNGTITFASEKGKGTTFIVTLPAAE